MMGRRNSSWDVVPIRTHDHTLIFTDVLRTGLRLRGKTGLLWFPHYDIVDDVRPFYLLFRQFWTLLEGLYQNRVGTRQ